MKGTLYLYVARDTTNSGGYSSAEKLVGRVAHRKESPKYNEVEFKLTLDIPSEMFEKPTYEAQISIKSADKSKSTPKLEVKADAVEVWLTDKEIQDAE